METLIIILFGLAWGSFLNVVIYRLPLGKSIIYPPSSCPRCGTRLRWYDNIPLLSFILLRGKCRSCHQPISLVYPLVETLTALSLLLLYYYHALSLPFFASAIFASGLIVLGFIDFFHQILPDEITFPLFFLALIYGIFRPDLNIRQVLAGALVGSGFLFVIYVAYFLLKKREGMGVGDIFMMLGVKKAILTLILASLVGAIIGLLLLLRKKKGWQFALPFGSFLAPAAFVSLLWGEHIISWYFGLFSLPG